MWGVPESVVACGGTGLLLSMPNLIDSLFSNSTRPKYVQFIETAQCTQLLQI